MKKRAHVNWSRACVGACSPGDPGDSSPPAASWDWARYLDFLPRHLGGDKQNNPQILQNARKRQQQKRGVDLLRRLAAAGEIVSATLTEAARLLLKKSL